MGKATDVRVNEVAFCAEVKAWADALFAKHPEWPFASAHIEQYGPGSNKRQDLRILLKSTEKPILSGEVKMPGTPEGRSPYSPELMRDAFEKADNIQADYFFTWNVNTFVLFDRSLYKRPMVERRLKFWDLGLHLQESGDCLRADVRVAIRDKFLPEFFAEFAAIVRGEVQDWGNPPDEHFINSLETHLDWPVDKTVEYLAVTASNDNAFAAKLQMWMAGEMGWSFDPDDPNDWNRVLERVSRTLCYTFCNRAIFYEAIRARHQKILKRIAMPIGESRSDAIYLHFRKCFEAAVHTTGDYEPIFYPNVADWAGSLVFATPAAVLGWQGVFESLKEFDFRKIPHDTVGKIFQRLIAPEERQKFGQFFTHEDIVDVINAFCIRHPNDTVLDPACGSGSFLVRAYQRKFYLAQHVNKGKRADHLTVLHQIFGCDIALFAAHLATLNLAAREITDEENYPYIARGNFFDVIEHTNSFCQVPDASRRNHIPIALPILDAVVGNPPYIRQEQILRRANLKRRKGEPPESFAAKQKLTKEHMQELCAKAWPNLVLGGRSDLHCYF